METTLPEQERWWHNKWRPAIAWSYVIICLFDFMLGPILFHLTQVLITGNIENIVQWEPRTLQAGGLYHLSMGAIIGTTAYGRTKEKLENMSLDFEVKTRKS
jgi:hypothetical protein